MPDPEVLHRSPLFRNFDAQERLDVLATTTSRSVAAGEVVLSMGDINTSLYVIESGSVKVTRHGVEQECEVATLGPGETFGEMSFLDGSRTTATLTAAAPTRVVELPRDAVNDLLGSHPALAAKLWLNLAAELKRRLAATNELVDHYADLNQLLADNPDCAELLSHT